MTPLQTILVVDDELQIVRVVRGYLEKANYRVVTASNGEEALRIARQEKPDLVVLDLQLPKMDGLEFTRRVRSEQPHLAIIMLTAPGSSSAFGGGSPPAAGLREAPVWVWLSPSVSSRPITVASGLSPPPVVD